MTCTVITIAIGMWLTHDTPETIVFEQCVGRVEPRVSLYRTNQEVEVVDYNEDTQLYYIKEKR